MSVYSPGFLTFSSPWIVSLWELQRVSGIKTCGGQNSWLTFTVRVKNISTLGTDLKV